jgi:hypothetical protein
MNYILTVPPKNKLVEYESRLLKEGSGLVFVLKILDFDEDDILSSLLTKYSKKTRDGKLKEDKDGNLIVNNNDYYAEMFKLLVKEIKGLEIPKGKSSIKFSPPWRIIKEVVNEGRRINSQINTGK